MRRNIASKIAAICFVAIIAVGCKAKKMATALVVTAPPVAVDNSKANTIAAIKSRQLSFNTFSGKASAELNIDNDNRGVTMNIRIDKGKKIWVSITALLNIEVARALITPDSIKLINKLQSVYVKQPFSYIHTYAGKQVNYATIEALLTGNAVPEFVSVNANLQKTDNNIALSGSMEQFFYKMIFNPELKLARLDLSNSAQQQSMQVNNSNFVLVDGRTLPSLINIGSSLKGKKISVNLDYSKVELDRGLEYPFNIPESYTPAN